MTTNSLVIVMTLFYAGALLLSSLGLVFRKKSLLQTALGLLAIAFVINSWAILDRWFAAGRPPFQTLYETLIFYPWCVGIVTLVLVALHRLYFLVPFGGGISVLGLGYALYKPDIEIISLPPALQSGWFVPHVVTYFVAYAALFASFALALLALAQPYWKSRLRNSSEPKPAPKFEQYAHQAAIFGIITLTLGLVMGSIWGKIAWGEYWAWDPKENWSLACWLAYMIYLHLRLVAGWKERKAMWVLIFAFGAVVFTYLGMSLLPSAESSLHTYK